MASIEVRTLFIGTDGEQAVDSKTAQKQIAEVEALECVMFHDGQALTWKDMDDPKKPRTIFQSILRDRELRVDNHTLMADKPSFAVITAVDGKAVRLEYYEGHEALSQVFDLRSRELQGKKLPNFLESDPHAYDPAKVLKDTLGMQEEVSKPILEAVHRNDGE